MITNIDIDEILVAQAMKVSGARTKREAVDRALREMVARAQRTRFRDIWGKATEADYFENYDPKAPPQECGLYRVEQPRASYKVQPSPPTPTPTPTPTSATATAKSRRRK